MKALTSMVLAIFRAVDEDVTALRGLNPQAGFSAVTPDDLKPQARSGYSPQGQDRTQPNDQKPYSTGE